MNSDTETRQATTPKATSRRKRKEPSKNLNEATLQECLALAVAELESIYNVQKAKDKALNRSSPTAVRIREVLDSVNKKLTTLQTDVKQ